MTVAIITITILVLIYIFGFDKKKYKELNKTERIKKSQIKNPSQPNIDRTDAMIWHTKKIQEGLDSGNLELVNLSYAKLIESIRQQNPNKFENHKQFLNDVEEEYENFRITYNFNYPKQFLPPSERNKKVNNKSGKINQNLIEESFSNEITNEKSVSIWIINNLKARKYNLIFNQILNLYLGDDSFRAESLKADFENYISKNYFSLINIEDAAIYEIQAFFILKRGIKDFNREFWISKDKESALLVKILSVYSFTTNRKEFEPLIAKANKFLNEIKKETDYWEGFEYYNLNNIKNDYSLNLTTKLADKLKKLSLESRLHFFDFVSPTKYRRYWNGKSSYETRSLLINEDKSFHSILALNIFKRTNDIACLIDVASKSDLKSRAESKKLEIKKSWSLKKIIENLSKSEKGKEFLENYLIQLEVFEIKKEYEADLKVLLEQQLLIKRVIDLIIMY